MKRIFLLLNCLLCVFSSILAQDDVNYENELEPRIELSLEKNFLNDALELNFSPSLRLGNNFEYDKTVLDLSVNYDLKGWFKIGVGGRLRFNETNKRGTEITSRLDVDLARNFNLNGFRIKPRIKYCHYFNVANTNDEPNDHLLRYKLEFDYRKNKKTIFTPEISVELFHNLVYGNCFALRYAVGGAFRINKHNSIAVSYNLHNDYNTYVNEHIVEVRYKYKF